VPGHIVPSAGKAINDRHQGDDWEDVLDVVGEVGSAVDVLLQRRPLAVAVALQELLGQLQHQTGSRWLG
jgi:hypothetical protein